MGVYEDELQDIFSDGEDVHDQSPVVNHFNCDKIFLRYCRLCLSFFF